MSLVCCIYTGKLDNYVDGSACQFVAVIDMNYMVYFDFFGCVLLPLLVMFAIYAYIYSVVRKQIRQIAAMTVPSIQTVPPALKAQETDPSSSFAESALGIIQMFMSIYQIELENICPSS